MRLASVILSAAALFAAPACQSPEGAQRAAETESNPYRQQVEAWTAEVAVLSAVRPFLQDVRVAIAGDCRKANPQLDEPDASMFCYCSGVVTTKLWLEMDQSREALLAHEQGEMNINSLLNLQGPELYGPVCSRAYLDEPMDFS